MIWPLNKKKLKLKTSNPSLCDYIKIYDLAFKQKTSNPSLYDCLTNYASNSKVTRAFPVQICLIISLLVVISQHKSQSTEENYYFMCYLCINH